MTLGIFAEAAAQSRVNAARYLTEEYHAAIDIRDFTRLDADDLWPAAHFDWLRIIRHDFGPAVLDLAIYVDGTLEVIAVCTGHGPQVIVRFVEGRPAGNPVLKGQRLWIVLEAAANFATGLGKQELWWHPESERFLSFCVETIGVERMGRQCRLKLPV